MDISDLDYIGSTICNMSGIPVRLYQNRQLVFLHTLVKLTYDPIVLDLEQLFKITNHVGYYINKDFCYYGLINFENYSFIIGPSKQTQMTKQEISDYAFEIGVPSSLKQEFISSMESITSMPLSSLIQMLCSINFQMNHEKLTINDIIDIQDNKPIEVSSNNLSEDAYHNTLQIEELITSFVENGNVDEFIKWSKLAPAVKSGKLSNSELRQLKNTFIVVTTLVARAALKGGLSTNDSFTLSDLYIQKCELLSDYASIVNLQYNMILEYTQKVQSIKIMNNTSKLYLSVTNYILQHLSESIKVDNISKALFMNRSYLSYQFKKVTGLELSKFIYQFKINEAKKLLKHEKNSIESISNYLGFSSQAHFTRTFKNIVGITPKKYIETVK